MLVCKGLGFDYSQNRVLGDISFSVPKGSFCAILGRNGAGKTTLLHCLNRILKPSSGQVELDGSPLERLSRRELARRVSLVPQEHTDIFPFRVIEVVVMGRTPHLSFSQRPGPEDYRLALEALTSLGYPHLASRNFNRISGGERRIALLARALLQTRRNLLFDEPTNHLDFHNQHLILSKIRDICRNQGSRAIATMHDPNLAGRFADQIILLKNGKVLAQGETARVMTSQNLSAVYDTPTRCITGPEGHCMYIPAADPG